MSASSSPLQISCLQDGRSAVFADWRSLIHCLQVGHPAAVFADWRSLIHAKMGVLLLYLLIGGPSYMPRWAFCCCVRSWANISACWMEISFIGVFVSKKGMALLTFSKFKLTVHLYMRPTCSSYRRFCRLSIVMTVYAFVLLRASNLVNLSRWDPRFFVDTSCETHWGYSLV